MNFKSVILSVFVLGVASCNNDSKHGQLGNATNDSVKVIAVVAEKIDSLSNPKNLVGHWFIPHNATVSITFTADGKFVFNDFNSKLDKEELLQGTFTLQSGVLTLNYVDRSKQKFKFYKGDYPDDNYYIKKGEYYFVKDDN